jgi:hypothetical protein
LTTAQERLAALLTSQVFSFTAAERATLQEPSDWIDEQLSILNSEAWTTADLSSIRLELGQRLARVHEMVVERQRDAAASVPTIESLVTRIDDLVARVGTVLRDVEREGLAVPATVRRGHARAVELIRESKRTCSTRRPDGCKQLRDVLETLDAMREPLCNLPSKSLSFCRA